jgi:hypothetical protein
VREIEDNGVGADDVRIGEFINGLSIYTPLMHYLHTILD